MSRFGSALSILDYVHMGSSISLRSYARLATSLSVQGLIHSRDYVGDGELMFHYASGGFLGASQATFGDLFTSMSEIHGALLASGGAVLGSPLGTEVKLDGNRGKYRVRYDGTETSFVVGLGTNSKRVLAFSETSRTLHGTWKFDQPTIHLTMARRRSSTSPSPPTPSASLILDNGASPSPSQGVISYGTDAKMLFTAGGARVLTTSATGSTLHGKWVAEEVIMVSDKRLKSKIRPLRAPASKDPQNNLTDAASWMLRELRPVSFHFKKGSESKPQEPQLRYGFIANEVQKVAPSLVRDIGENLKGIAYLDLVALTIAAQQAQQEEMQEVSVHFRLLEEKVDRELKALRSYVEARIDLAFSEQSRHSSTIVNGSGIAFQSNASSTLHV